MYILNILAALVIIVHYLMFYAAFQIDFSAPQSASFQAPLLATFKAAHGDWAVSLVRMSPSQIITAGGGGCLCKYDYLSAGPSSAETVPTTEGHTSSHQGIAATTANANCTTLKIQKLVLVSCERQPGVNSLFDEIDTNVPAHRRSAAGALGVGAMSSVGRLIAGFTANNFVLWSCQQQAEILRVDCGGSRRPVGLLVPGPDQFIFAYYRNHNIYVHRRCLKASAACGSGWTHF